MLFFTVYPYTDWKKDYHLFEAELATRGIKIKNCRVGSEEILITIIANTEIKKTTAVNIARKCFGRAYIGML